MAVPITAPGAVFTIALVGASVISSRVFRFSELGKAEVQYLRIAGAAQHHVFRFDIAIPPSPIFERIS